MKTFGYQLVDSISIPQTTLNFLFAALLLTALGVFLGGNLLLLDVSVLQHSVQIALPCFALLLIFYAASRSMGSVVWGLVLTYGLMWAITFSRQAGLIYVVYGMAGFALMYAIRYLRVNRQQLAMALVMAIIATATVLGCRNAYTSFDMLPRLYAGNVHQDTLYHASIAAMIKNYGVVSTGLHGLVETPYHVFSHILMASISLLSGLGVIEVYGVANWVLFAPLLIFSVVAFCVMVDRDGQLKLPLLWVVVCLLLVATPFLFYRWAIWDSFFVSESYLVSLGLFILGLSLLYKDRLSFPDLVLVLVLTAMITNAKGSVGIVFAILWSARIIFLRGQHLIIESVTLLLMLAIIRWIAFDSATSWGNSGGFEIYPLHFIGLYSFFGGYIVQTGKALLTGNAWALSSMLLALASILSFLVIHFLFSWIAIAQVASRKGLLALVKVPIAIYSLVAVIIGLLIVAIFASPGGSLYYFSNVAFFVSLPAVAVIVTEWIDRKKLVSSRFVILCIILMCAMDIKGFYGISMLNPMRSVHPSSPLIDSLLELRKSNQTNVVLQADSTILAANPIKRCTAQPFVFPAVSERPWMDIIPARADCTYDYFGYNQYGINKSQQQVSVQPKMLPGMTILAWQPIMTNVRSNNQ